LGVSNALREPTPYRSKTCKRQHLYIDDNSKMSTAQHCKHRAYFGMHVTPSLNPEKERNLAVAG